MEQLNNLIKKTTTPSNFKETEYYIDFLNLACLIGGVRNGAHLDTIQNTRVMNKIKREVPFNSNTRYETTFWRKEKLTEAQVLNSWAFQGDMRNMLNTEYWQNNAILLGNNLGYPTFTADPKKRGSWSLNLVFNSNGNSSYPSSMMGGCYDKTIKGDLASIEQIKEFLEDFVGKTLYNPRGHLVFLEKVVLEIK
jgi:hypothetical protein